MKTIHKIVALLAGAVLLIALGTAVSFSSLRHTEEAAEARKHTRAVITNANGLLSELKDAETGQRGYLLSGKDAYLDHYHAVVNDISNHLNELRRDTSNSDSRSHLDALAPLIDSKLNGMAEVIQLRRGGDEIGALALFNSGDGKRLMDAIRTEVIQFDRIESDALAQLETEASLELPRSLVLIVVSSMLALLAAIAFAFLMHRQTQQRLKSLLLVETQHLLEAQEVTNSQLQHANFTLQVNEAKLAVTLNSIGDAVIATDAESLVTFLRSGPAQLDRFSDFLSEFSAV